MEYTVYGNTKNNEVVFCDNHENDVVNKLESSIAKVVCPKCGHTANDGANFCEKCGTRLKANPLKEEPAENKQKISKDFIE